MSIVSGNRAAAGAIKDALGRGPGVSRGLSDRAGNIDRYQGFKKRLKDKEDKTSGTTGDPDNPTLDELRDGIYEPVEDRFPVQGGRRRRRTVSH